MIFPYSLFYRNPRSFNSLNKNDLTQQMFSFSGFQQKNNKQIIHDEQNAQWYYIRNHNIINVQIESIVGIKRQLGKLQIDSRCIQRTTRCVIHLEFKPEWKAAQATEDKY